MPSTSGPGVLRRKQRVLCDWIAESSWLVHRLLRGRDSSLRVGVAGVKSDGLAEVLDGLGGQPLREQFPSARYMEARLRAGIAGGQALLICRLNLSCYLAEGFFVVGALDAFQRQLRRQGAGGILRIAGCDQSLEQALGLGVVRAHGQETAQLAGGSRGIAFAKKSYRHSQL